MGKWRCKVMNRDLYLEKVDNRSWLESKKQKNIAGCDHGNLLRKRCLNKTSLFIFINCMVSLSSFLRGFLKG